MAEFNVVGSYLKDAYRKAIKVSSNGNNIGRIKRANLATQLTVSSVSSSPNVNSHTSVEFDLPLDHKRYPELHSPASSSSPSGDYELPIGKLAFSEDSPDYCSHNLTIGRICSKRRGADVTPEERRSCRNLCRNCGLKVKRQKKKVTRQCNCRFQWCCTVHCDVCETEEETYTCANTRPGRMFDL